ncbi:MAG: hypothetical protein AAFQ71_14285, partial [Planctomycetota bacterium]
MQLTQRLIEADSTTGPTTWLIPPPDPAVYEAYEVTLEDPRLKQLSTSATGLEIVTPADAGLTVTVVEQDDGIAGPDSRKFAGEAGPRGDLAGMAIQTDDLSTLIATEGGIFAPLGLEVSPLGNGLKYAIGGQTFDTVQVGGRTLLASPDDPTEPALMIHVIGLPNGHESQLTFTTEIGRLDFRAKHFPQDDALREGFDAFASGVADGMKDGGNALVGDIQAAGSLVVDVYEATVSGVGEVFGRAYLLVIDLDARFIEEDVEHVRQAAETATEYAETFARIAWNLASDLAPLYEILIDGEDPARYDLSEESR